MAASMWNSTSDRVALAGVMLGGLMVGLWHGRDQATKESCAAA